MSISEEGLEAPVVDDDCLIVLAQGCPRLRRLSLRHCSAVSDVGARAVASRCKLLQASWLGWRVLRRTGEQRGVVVWCVVCVRRG